MGKRHDCPVCGEKDIFEEEGSYDICPICGWEDDDIQFDYPDIKGANRMTLNQAREAYKKGLPLN